MSTNLTGGGTSNFDALAVAGAASIGGALSLATTPNVSTAQSMVRLNTANGYGSTNTMIRRYTNATAQGSDITYADSATLGASLTINTSGVYSVYIDWDSTASSYQGVSVNSSQLTTSILNINVADRVCYSVSTGAGQMSTGTTLYLSVGTVVRPHTDSTATGTNSRNTFIITRVA